MTSVDASEGSAVSSTLTVALVGNPNCGKTTLFNALTGLRQKVGNYAGVTVEKKEGRIVLPGGRSARLLDLPGLYSLTPHSPDEVIAREVLLGLRDDTPRPDVILNVVDASNLERNLYITSQLLDIGLPVVVVLTMTDTLEQDGTTLHLNILEQNLGVPVCAVVASRKRGLNELLASLTDVTKLPVPEPGWKVPSEIEHEIAGLQSVLEKEQKQSSRIAFAEAVSLLMQESEQSADAMPASLYTLVQEAQARMQRDGIDFAALTINARYKWIDRVCEGVTLEKHAPGKRPISTNERVDRVIMHPFWGYAIFVVVMAVVFQAIFSFGDGPANFVKDSIRIYGGKLLGYLPSGDLHDLINEGVLGGVGTTLGFLPQILLLFFFISLLEDTGYMARAAFLMDRLMSKVGLHGKSFIPLLSSFACAIPGIMATRTIGDRKARLITILVAPLMSCSARLPVYFLMTSAFIPNKPLISLFGHPLLTLQGATFVSMYFLGMIAAFCIAWLFHRTLLKGVSPTFLMELPPYRLPSLKTAVIQMVERAWLFVRRAATIILAVSVVVWFLSSYPKRPGESKDQAFAHSYIGHIGHFIEPVIRPLGFNWKMGVGIASSFIAREVFVSTMGTVYSVDDPEKEKGQTELGQKMAADRDERTGRPIFTPLVAVCLMIYYVLAMQCMSTVAVVRRETNGWKWPLFQVGYMSLLAWGVTFVVYHIGLALGWG